MTEPRRIDFTDIEPVSHDADVNDAEVDVDGTRWALVTYAPGAGRADWCDTPHSGYVLDGDAHVQLRGRTRRSAPRTRRGVRAPAAAAPPRPQRGPRTRAAVHHRRARVTPARSGQGAFMGSGTTRVVAVDVGGTFTDVCVLDQSSGELEVAKVASTKDPIDGVMAGVEEAGIDLSQTALFCHGTTVATNALITRRLPKAAMVCTQGLPRRRGDRPRHARRPVGRVQGQRRAVHPAT